MDTSRRLEAWCRADWRENQLLWLGLWGVGAREFLLDGLEPKEAKPGIVLDSSLPKEGAFFEH